MLTTSKFRMYAGADLTAAASAPHMQGVLLVDAL